MTTSEDSLEWHIMGRLIGRATGWDQADTFVMQLYDFKPAKRVKLPEASCITFNFETGLAETYDDDGKILTSDDIVDAISHLPTVNGK